MIRIFLGTFTIVVIAIVYGASNLPPDTADFLLWALHVGVYMCIGAPVIAIIAGYIVWRQRQGRRAVTYKDGALPLMHRKRRIWRTDIPRPLAVWSFLVGEEFVIDPNRIVGPAFSFDAFGRFSEVVPQAGYALQHQYNALVERTNVARAIYQGDDSHDNLFGRDALPPRAPARALMEAKPAQLPPEDEPMQPMIVEPKLTPQLALDRSHDGVVCIGQQGEGSRRLAMWDANSASTLGIFGANGTGKTSSVATMATLAMVRWGWKLWILDGKDAGDWDEFDKHANVMPVAQHNIDDAMQAIWEEYQRREKVMSEYRVRHYRHLPPEIQAEFPQWGVVFEEFGATRLGLRQKTRAALDQCIGILCQKARYTGWHGVFIDQRPSDYTNEMKGNLKAIACFKLMMNQGHAVNAYDAGKLADVGEFQMDGERYFAFHAEPLARPLLASAPAVRARSQPRTNERFTNDDERLTNGSVHETNGAAVRNSPPVDGLETLGSIYERTRSWDEVGRRFFADNPDRMQADLRRVMSGIDGREPNTFKGEAHRIYHAFSPHGKRKH